MAYPASAIGCLMREHRVIERVIPVMSQLAREAREGHADARRIDKATDFIRTYADRCHHGKEEDILFANLAGAHMASEDTQMMADLIRDHEFIRGVVRRLVAANDRWAAGDKSVLPEIADTLETLVRLYPPHILKEDTLFFRQAITYLSREHRDSMLHEFKAFDRDLIHEKYADLVKVLGDG